MAAALLADGLEGQLAYRPTNNPYVDQRIRDSRRAYGLKLSVTKGLEGGRELMAHLARGSSIGVLIDQKYREGPAVPFFGHPANTQPVAPVPIDSELPIRSVMFIPLMLVLGVTAFCKSAPIRSSVSPDVRAGCTAASALAVALKAARRLA